MIHVDHQPGTGPTIAESDHTPGKRVRDLAPGDAIAVNFRGWGTLIMKVLYKSWANDDADGMRLELQENVFHLTVGPLMLLLTWLAWRRPAARPAVTGT